MILYRYWILIVFCAFSKWDDTTGWLQARQLLSAPVFEAMPEKSKAAAPCEDEAVLGDEEGHGEDSPTFFFCAGH